MMSELGHVLRSRVHPPRREGGRRESGILLVQVALAIPILLIGAMGFFFAFQSNFKATQEIIWRDLEMATFDNAIATLNNQVLADLVANYQGLSIASPTSPTSTYGQGYFDIQELESLRDADGNPVDVTVQFFLDETKLPTEFGPIVDIDGIGTVDVYGNGALNTVDCSNSYEILPTRLTLTYDTPRGLVTRQKFVILGPK